MAFYKGNKEKARTAMAEAAAAGRAGLRHVLHKRACLILLTHFLRVCLLRFQD